MGVNKGIQESKSRFIIHGGDVTLANNGVQIATDSKSLSEMERVLSAENKNSLELTVFREGKVITLKQ